MLKKIVKIGVCARGICARMEKMFIYDEKVR